VAEQVTDSAQASPTPSGTAGGTPNSPVPPPTTLPSLDAVRPIGPKISAVTNNEGVAIFPDLPIGIYRVAEESNQALKARTFLVAIPSVNPDDPDKLLYDVHAYPKLETAAVPVTPRLSLSRTGPTAVLIIGALACLVAANISIVRSRKKDD